MRKLAPMSTRTPTQPNEIRNPKPWFRSEHRAHWYYNVNQEQRWNDSAVFPSVTDLLQLELVKQQEQQLLFLADAGDTVWFRHMPDESFLAYLQDFGIALPRIVLPDDWNDPLFPANEPATFIPYIQTAEIQEMASRSGSVKLWGPDAALAKRINHKLRTREWIQQRLGFAVTAGAICMNLEELQSAYETLRSRGFETCVLKVPYGSSGKGLRVIDRPAVFDMLCKYIARRGSAFELLLEGWYGVRQHLNSQLWIGEDGPRTIAVTSQSIDGQGVYRGTDYMPVCDPTMLSAYYESMTRLGAQLHQEGYRGICGVDSIVADSGELFPVIEINARFTQVTYLLPVVEPLSRQYPHIVSSFIRTSLPGHPDFRSVHAMLRDALSPDSSNRFLVYTFASYPMPKESATMYRIFVLFYGQDETKVRDMQARFQQLGK